MQSSKTFRVLLASVIGLILFACTVFIGGPEYPDRRISVSTEAAGELFQNIEQEISTSAANGQVVIHITEVQLTSYLAVQFQRQPDPFLSDLQVFLQDQTIQVYGRGTQGYFTATAAVMVAASINDQDKLAMDIVSADFGPLPIPDDFLDFMTGILEEALTGPVGPVATGIRLTDIQIQDGILTITGSTK